MEKCTSQVIFPQERTKPWMMNLSNKLISELSLPGTHDSCCNLDCGILQCHTWSLEKQLKNGIRFLDIRCRHFENRLDIHHDWVYCNLTFDEVIKICRIFLKDAPSECLVMRVKQEYIPCKCSRKFDDTFKEVYEKNKDILYLNQRIPFVNELRGKIWILIDFECNNLNTYKWSQASIQDMWCIENNQQLKTKLQNIHLQFLNTLKGSSEKLYLNFLSGTGNFGWPKKISQLTNSLSSKYKGKLGIVIFDFPNIRDLNHIIEQNHFTSIPIRKIIYRPKKQCSQCNKKFIQNFNTRNREYLGSIRVK
jgi:1-phosphatidylinositol phosphodiesterase